MSVSLLLSYSVALQSGNPRPSEFTWVPSLSDPGGPVSVLLVEEFLQSLFWLSASQNFLLYLAGTFWGSMSPNSMLISVHLLILLYIDHLILYCSERSLMPSYMLLKIFKCFSGMLYLDILPNHSWIISFSFQNISTNLSRISTSSDYYIMFLRSNKRFTFYCFNLCQT